MAIPDISKKDLERALLEFDVKFRDAADWSNWQEDRSHKYAIRHFDNLYPAKMAISLATGHSRQKFSGGESAGAANQFVRDLGFEVIPLRGRNPPWLRDELILALDLYLQDRESPPGKSSAPVLELSYLFSRVGPALQGQSFPQYRNPNGVYMKLMNFRGHDPMFPKQKGLEHGSQLEGSIWEEFGNDPTKCHIAANSIRAAFERLLTDPSLSHPVSDEEDYEASEGRAVTRIHVTRERNRKLIEKKKTSALKKNGHLACEVCGFDFAKCFGERGKGFIECHHEKPVTEMSAGEKTNTKDLRLVCSNCHRMIHTKKPWLTVTELSQIIGENS